MKQRFFVLSMMILLFALPSSRAQTIIDENFDNFPPSGWTIIGNGSGNWHAPTDKEKSDFANPGGFAAHLDDASCSDWLISSAISLSADNGYLKYSLFYKYPGYSAENSIFILASQDTSDIIDTIKYEMTSDYITSNVWLDTLVSLANYNGQTIYIAFKYKGDYADYWGVDSFWTGYRYNQDIQTLQASNFVELNSGKFEVLVKNAGFEATNSGFDLQALFYDGSTTQPFYTSISNTLDSNQTETVNMDVQGLTSGFYSAVITANYSSDQYTDNNSITVPVIAGYVIGSGDVTAANARIYDNEGPLAPYTNGEKLVTTIYPDNNVGEKITVTFDSISIAVNDTLFVYDGADTNSTVLAKISGEQSDISFTSTNSAGAITLSFYRQNGDTSALYGFAALATTIAGFTPADDTFAPEISVYPNPATDFVKVKNAKGYYLEISDMSGRIILSKQLNEDNSNISINSLQKGIYIMRFTNGNKTYTNKLLVK